MDMNPSTSTAPSASATPTTPVCPTSPSPSAAAAAGLRVTTTGLCKSVGPTTPVPGPVEGAMGDDVDMQGSPCKATLRGLSSSTLRAGAPSSARGSPSGYTAPVVIALDNDEATGSYGDLSLLYTVYTHVLHIDPPVTLFAELLTATGTARPHLRELFDTCTRLRAEGKVSKVMMVTAARDTVGWVSFLRKALEAWYGAPVYDDIIEGGMLLEWNAAHGVTVLPTGCAIYKDMNHVRHVAGVPQDTPVLMVDDRPENIVNGTTHGVVPYNVAVNLVAVAQTYVPEYTPTLHQRYAATLQETWQSFLRDSSTFTVAYRDVALKEAATAISTFVDTMWKRNKPVVLRSPAASATEDDLLASCRSISRSASLGSGEFCETPRATAA